MARALVKRQKKYLVTATAAALNLVRPMTTPRAAAEIGTNQQQILLTMKILQLQRSTHWSFQENEL